MSALPEVLYGRNSGHRTDDGLGSVRLIVDATGAIEGAFDHDVWGVPDTSVTPPGAELQAHTFVGGLGQRNEGDGLYYARQRWYDANLARWLSADPIGFSGSLNLYSYVDNNPVGWVDPSGLQGEEIIQFAGRAWVITSGARQAAPIVINLAKGSNPYGWALTGAGMCAVPAWNAWNAPAARNTPGSSSLARFVSNFPSQSTNFRGYYPPNAPPIFRRGMLPASEVVGRPRLPGRAPIGRDGHPVEMHHADQSTNVVDEYTRSDHRLGPNYTRNHTNTGQCPSNVNRSEWKAQREHIWRADLREGRFDGLP